MATAVSQVSEFGPFRLEPDHRLLLRDGEPVPLTPKSYDALVLLIENSGRVVSKDELMKALWPDTFVDEANLTQTIFMLRKALGESAGSPGCILTAPGHGYRFAAEFKIPNNVSDGPPLPVAAPAPAKKSHRAVSAWLVITSVIAAALLMAPFVSRERPHLPTATRSVVAVLPFENLTGDATQDYFSDGLTEEMISQIGRLDPQRLGVVARTSVMHYKQSPAPLDEVARDLGANYVLEGTVRRDGGKVRISAQLIQVKDQTHLWAGEYDRQLTGLLTIQAELAQQVADEIQQALSGEHNSTSAMRQEPDLSPQAYAAYDLYLKGRYFWNRRTKEGLDLAVAAFQDSIVKDPNYDRSYAGLADAYALQSSYGFGPAAELMPKAKEAALHALQLDDKLAEAHASLALIEENFDWDWPAAEKEFRRAIELNPNYATAHHWYAEYLAFMGRFDEALAESDKARSLDPLSLIIAADHGVIQYFARRYTTAAGELKSVLDLDPDVGRAYMVVEALTQQRRFAEALAYNQKLREHVPSDHLAWSWAKEAAIYGRSGDRQRAQHALNELVKLKRQWPSDSAMMLSVAYAGAGKNNEAITVLEQAYRDHSSALLSLKVDPIYDPLRQDARFQQIIGRVGLN